MASAPVRVYRAAEMSLRVHRNEYLRSGLNTGLVCFNAKGAMVRKERQELQLEQGVVTE